MGNTFQAVTARNSITVHPHACGEHCAAPHCRVSCNGSSPRMWGTLSSMRKPIAAERFIPTHVGNTFLRPASTAARSVHPHACGEHVETTSNGDQVIGSSPRMWGTRGHSVAGLFMARFIPTHVGNTRQWQGLFGLLSVHPHACGEHFGLFSMHNLKYGSSPRMWGTRLLLYFRWKLWRFIPTHVGNT